MPDDRPYLDSMSYWERAGERGYDEAMYRCSEVEQHIRGRFWNAALEIADMLNVPRDAHVLDLGCGDGAFANKALAGRYRAVDGMDLAGTAIKRAQGHAPGLHVRFRAVDITTLDYQTLPRYDAVFLIGILHHVKQASPLILAGLAQCTKCVIVLEPNGNNLLRKALELTPSYRAAGEDSFTFHQIINMFSNVGYQIELSKKINIFPNFTPRLFYKLFAPLENFIESNDFLNFLCTVNIFGFKTARSVEEIIS